MYIFVVIPVKLYGISAYFVFLLCADYPVHVSFIADSYNPNDDVIGELQYSGAMASLSSNKVASMFILG